MRQTKRKNSAATNETPECLETRSAQLIDWVAHAYELPGGGGMNFPQELRGVPDPHKFVWPKALARLSIDLADPWSIAMIDQFWKEGPQWGASYYHFAAVGLIRLLFQFPSSVGDLREPILDRSRVETQMASGVGTENHQLMWRSSGYLFAQETDSQALVLSLRDWLLGYVNRLEAVGQGEFDSSTYLPFCATSLVNLYDFAKDEEIRAASKRALDLLATHLALKTVGGILIGAESRGGSIKPFETNASIVSWLWWGGAPYESVSGRNNIYAIHPAFSDYRPPDPCAELSQKRDLKAPRSYRLSYPNYLATESNEAKETLTISPTVSLGALYTLQGGWCADNQTTMWRAALQGLHGVGRGFAGGSSAYAEQNGFKGVGRGPFDQVAQVGTTIVFLHRVPLNAEQVRSEVFEAYLNWKTRSEKAQFQEPCLEPWTFLRVSEDSRCELREDAIWGDTDGLPWVCYPLAARTSRLDEHENVFRFDHEIDTLGGFVLEFAPTRDASENFVSSREGATPVVHADRVRYVAADGTPIEVEYQTSGRFTEPEYDWGPAPEFPSGEGHGKIPKVWVDGGAIPLIENWPPLDPNPLSPSDPSRAYALT